MDLPTDFTKSTPIQELLPFFPSRHSKRDKPVTCRVCGATTYRTTQEVNRSKWFFCSQRCHAVLVSGGENRWKGKPRLWELVRDIQPTDACVEWVHASWPTLVGNYGRVEYKGELWHTHRLSYTLHHGHIPDGMEICHRCDNPPCYNPRHLFLGTHAENMQDCVNKGRRHIPKGEQKHNAKLTEPQVREIRKAFIPARYGRDPLSNLKELAIRYRISESTIHSVVYRQTWRHVE